MRRWLDTLYAAAGVLAAVFMIGVLVCIGLAIVTRQMAIHIPGLDAYAGYCMAAAGFLALAHTLKKGEHIRVTLLLSSLPEKQRTRLDAFALIIGTLIAANLAWFSCKLVLDSHAFSDISTGEDATPLWIPQLSMAVGTVIFFVALLDTTLTRLRGIPDETSQESALHE
ncbi:MAG TPA: TRAP transporter small permease [Burkholderiaceae bacterium]|jgi:TRAP-type C4-dicarboxylate transport system permease small subunit|nr:TRAP transporter small permease [Burkholderiaceae bacterium]